MVCSIILAYALLSYINANPSMAMLLRQWNLREAEAVEEAEGEDVAGVGVESLLSQHTLRTSFSTRRNLFLQLR